MTHTETEAGKLAKDIVDHLALQLGQWRATTPDMTEEQFFQLCKRSERDSYRLARAYLSLATPQGGDVERARAFVESHKDSNPEPFWDYVVTNLPALFAQVRAQGAEWRPIETAPKTGDDLLEKCVLAYCKEDHPNDRFKVVWWEPKIKGGVWWSDQDCECQPTHWQPLPSPPSKVE